MALEQQLGSFQEVKRISSCLAAGVLETGRKVLVCRKIARNEFALVWQASALPAGQRASLSNAGFIC